MSRSVNFLSAATLRVTRYADVCGGTDEFKRVLAEELNRAKTLEGRTELASLVTDCSYMIARMQVRLNEYEAFRDAMRATLASLDAIVAPDMPVAYRETVALGDALGNGNEALDARDLTHLVEEVRQVANDMEGVLRRHQEGAIGLARTYAALRGHRGWPDGLLPEATVAGPTAKVPSWIPQGWLPPSPHAERIVDLLVRGRAALLSDSELDLYPVGSQGREPVVQFEDGGVMPLRLVRWDYDIENFRPLGQAPHP